MNKPHKWAEVIKAAADGQTIQWKPNAESEWSDYEPEHAFATFAWQFGEYRVKPPAPKWPETTMDPNVLYEIFRDHQGSYTQSCVMVANAVLAHALETGQVVLP